jgi:hypothetical protein
MQGDISASRIDRICTILDELETKAPRDARESLQNLAHLSTCQEQHRDDYSKVNEGISKLKDAVKDT